MSQIEDAIYHDEDALLDHAYNIFLELASDNLPETQIQRFNAQFSEQGALELHVPFSDWLDYLGEEIDTTQYVEVVIGLQNKDEELVHRFAHILLAKDEEDKLCHIIWSE